MSQDENDETQLAGDDSQPEDVAIIRGRAFQEQSRFFMQRMGAALGDRGRKRGKTVYWDNDRGICWAAVASLNTDGSMMSVRFYVAGVTMGFASTVAFPTSRVDAFCECLASNRYPGLDS